jgi:predicted metal-dependent phosphoesterase TrpH
MVAIPTTAPARTGVSGERKTLRADLHSHTHFSRDGFSTPEQFARRCVRRDINCVAVSDHNNIVGALEVEKVAKRLGGGALRVIIAEEIKSAEGEIIGWFLRDPVPKGLTPEDTVRAIKEQGGLVCVPHPFDRLRGSVLQTPALLRILPDVDAVEAFNARTSLRADNRRSAAFVRSHGTIASAGSDAHWHPELGGTYVTMPDFEGPGDFLDALRAGRIHGEIANPLVHLVSTIAKVRFRLGFGPAK